MTRDNDKHEWMQTPSTTALLRRAVALAKTDASLFEAYRRMRRNANALTRPVSLDLTSRCNLYCEGCYYYEGDTPVLADEVDIDKWSALFRRKAEEGTRFAYFGGAEPALYPERLRAAAAFIPYGTLATNGTLKIPHDIPYRITVSV
ncbi:radical SAM protein [Marinobacterium aestuariivivens]|uniref:Radical SAM protein n=1 Tax=Marinobacterium aestuariivivens TaxID=1698799 RepID=A0ABW1ZUD4_9GAMM